MTDKISDFLNEVDLQSASRRTWGIGTMIARGSAKAAQAVMNISIKSAEDQFIISASNDVAIPIIAESLRKISLGLKDPALFDFPTATFAIYMGQEALGRMNLASLVFITLRAVSENSTHVLIVGYAKEPFKNHIATGWVKKVRNAISAKFP